MHLPTLTAIFLAAFAKLLSVTIRRESRDAEIREELESTIPGPRFDAGDWTDRAGSPESF